MSPAYPQAAMEILAECQGEVTLEDIEQDQHEATAYIAFCGDDEQREDDNQAKDNSKLDPREANLLEASKGVVTEDTSNGYLRGWDKFVGFIVKEGYIPNAEAVKLWSKEAGFPKDVPKWVAIWIMSNCNEKDIWTGKPRPMTNRPAGYSTAQKNRASVSHVFSRTYEMGMQPWGPHPHQKGRYIGNPSLSVTISTYMTSLKRRKIQGGEVTVSSRAMDEATMRSLCFYNATFEDIKIPKPLTKEIKNAHPEFWGGRSLRRMLECGYTTAMLCLFRIDELLRLKWEDVTWEVYPTAPYGVRMKIEVHWRKTNQNGSIAPFYLYGNPDKPWLCPLRAWALWFKAFEEMGGKTTGWVFRQKGQSPDDLSLDETKCMTAASFLKCLRNNLLDIDIDGSPYGTHCFRRGDCQHLAIVLRWPYRDICTWAGWSDNLDNPVTLFKYLLSHVDVPHIQREDYFNTHRPIHDRCNYCGRTCSCS